MASIIRPCFLLVTLLYMSQTSALKITCEISDSNFCTINGQDLMEINKDEKIILSDSSFAKVDIKTVTIKNCQLPFVPNDLLSANFRSLETLNIQNCSLEEFKTSAHKYLKNFYLTNTDLTYLRNNPFKDWPSLENLDMSNNKISLIDPGTFDTNLDLLNVNFGNNSIKKLPKRLFSNNKQLKNVDFSNNQIEKIRNELFGNLSALGNLNFHNNQLNAISPDFYNGLPTHIHFDLTKNACINNKFTRKEDPKILNNCFLRYRLDDSKESVDQKLHDFGKYVTKLLKDADESNEGINQVGIQVITAGSGVGGLVLLVMAFVVFTIFKSRNNKVAQDPNLITTKPIVQTPSTSKNSTRHHNQVVVRVETSSDSSSESSSSSRSSSESDHHKRKVKFSKEQAVVHYKKGKR